MRIEELSFQRTYEELKLVTGCGRARSTKSFQRTYEELKHGKTAIYGLNREVFSVPMRN